jgi:integrase
MPVHLTESAIAKATREAAATGRRVEVADAGCQGLRLRVTPNGGRTWILGCRDRAGAARRFPLGDHPTMGIAAARDAARALHAKVKRDGADPIAEARQERAHAANAKVGIGTLAAVLALYGERKGGQLKSWPHSRLRIDRVFRALLDQPVAGMTIGNLQLTADRYRTPKSASFAIRALRPALKWAAEPGRRYVAKELADLREPTKLTRRKRVLSRDELRAVLPILRQSTRRHADAMQFILLTVARLEEVCAARWREISLPLATWTLPPERTKNEEPHAVPLPRQAVELLSRIGPGGPDERVFTGARGSALGNWDRARKAIQTASGTRGWHCHDLRRTGTTLMGEMGYPPHICEAALNHVNIGSALAATYNRARYFHEVADALQRLADLLDGIAAGGADVIPIRRTDPTAA